MPRIRFYSGFDSNGKWQCVPESEAKEKLYLSPEKAREAHAVIADEMPPTVHPCDGQTYTSKSKFREVTKQHGKIEVGNEWEAFTSGQRGEDPRPTMTESLRQAAELCETLQGKSEGERREIQRRFFGESYNDFAQELEMEAVSRGHNSHMLELKDRYLEKYGER